MISDQLQIVWAILLLSLPLFSSSSSSSSSSSLSLKRNNLISEPKYTYVSDNCDWYGSKTLDQDSDRSVVPIYLRCSRGSIKWFYPTGGLRVVLKLGTNDKDFHGCIRVARNTSRNVRVYIEGRKQLFQIFSANDGKHPDLFRCFVSVNHFMALFIETDANSLYPNDPVIFDYDLQEMNIPLSLSSLSSTVKMDCHSCADETLLKAFCSSDFALTGRISYYKELPELDLIEFNVKPFHIYRLPTNGTFINDQDLTIVQLKKQSTNKSDNDDHDDEKEENNAIDLQSISSSIILNRSLKCHQSAANDNIDNFQINNEKQLFLGKLILGKYFIICSTSIDHWNQLKMVAILAGQNQCHLS